MIPAEFDYPAPESLDEAIRELHENGDDAKLLAGGHSLLPLMKLRLAAPALLIDLRRIPGLHGIERENGSCRIGAMTPTRRSPRRRSSGSRPRRRRTIADPQVRNRGTIGGSLAHGDPASDLPAVMVAIEGIVDRPGAGEASARSRRPTSSWTTSTTALEPDEVRHRGPPAGARRLGLTATRSSTGAPRTGRWSRSARWSRPQGGVGSDVPGRPGQHGLRAAARAARRRTRCGAGR